MKIALTSIMCLLGFVFLLEKRATHPDLAIPIIAGLSIMYLVVVIQYWRDQR